MNTKGEIPMKRNLPIFLFLLLVVLALFSNSASSQEDKTATIIKDYKTSLHATGSGMKHWYSKEQGGTELVFGAPYDQLNCSGCHDKSCDSCHEIFTNEKGEKVVKAVKPENACLECHFVEKAELGKLKKENGSADVHFIKGMKCMDCHTSREMHGDGKQYDSFQQTGAMDVSCETCHTDLTTIESHQVHGNKLSCNSCHVRNIPTCYNCHFDTKTNKGKSVSPQLEGMLFLVNHKGQVNPANLHTFVAGNKAMIVFSPFFSHSIMKEGRTCAECHESDLLLDIRKNNFYPVTWENGKLRNVKGVIPVAEKMKWNFVYLKNEDKTWLPLEAPSDVRINYSGFCSPLTQEQLSRLEMSVDKRTEK